MPSTDERTALPTGTVTFLFTDIEGSTRLLQRLGEAYGSLLEEHHRLLTHAVEEAGGVRFGSEGDAIFAVFARPGGAVRAAANAQRRLAATRWPGGERVRVRMGIHTGEGRLAGGSFVGLDVHRVARIAGAGHGGQVLLSGATRALVDAEPLDGVHLRDLGEHRLKDLDRPEHLYQLVVAGLPADFPPPRSLTARPNNLPAALTSFVGREREVAEVRNLLSRSRLVTLSGPGGTGKTRLSLEVGRRTLPEFDDGVFFVPLAPVRDPGLVPSAIAQVLDVQSSASQSPLEAVEQHLGERHLLLVLDNFEQVVPAAPLVSRLLAGAPRLRVVVTSREVLRVSGEQEYAVPPLRLPKPSEVGEMATVSSYDAVVLFVDRARAVHPSFALTDDNIATVVEICRRLDALPLAIELAAARTKLLGPAALLQRLERRLPLLAGGPRDLPARQRTLRDAIGWSYDLLEERERRLFRRLGVFVGGAALDGIEEVCAPEGETDLLDDLGSLVDKSLLRQSGDTGEPRIWMLETIREYALERLDESGEGQEVRRRHARLFLAVAEEAAPHLTSVGQAEWSDRLTRELGNFRAAMRWAVDDDDAELGLRMGAALWRFWQFRGDLAEGRDVMEDLLALPSAAAHTPARARGLDALAGVLYWQADYAGARERYEAALDIWRELEDPTGTGDVLYSLGYVELVAGQPAVARDRFEESRALARRADDRKREAYAGMGISLVALVSGDYPGTAAAAEETASIFEGLGEVWGVANALGIAGRARARLGEPGRARVDLARSISILREIEDVPGLAWAMDDLAHVEIAEGNVERGLRLGGAAEAIREALGARAPIQLTESEDPRPKVRGLLDDEAIEREWAAGRAMTPQEASAYALGVAPAPRS